MEVYNAKFRRIGSVLAASGSGRAGDILQPDFEDWHLQLDPCAKSAVEDVQELLQTGAQIICCPEDQVCKRDCVQQKRLCAQCRVPICRQCRLCLCDGQIVPHGLMNDNWWG